MKNKKIMSVLLVAVLFMAMELMVTRVQAQQPNDIVQIELDANDWNKLIYSHMFDQATLSLHYWVKTNGNQLMRVLDNKK